MTKTLAPPVNLDRAVRRILSKRMDKGLASARRMPEEAKNTGRVGRAA
ncbi:hypothetical protein [Sphingomonas gellani]|nr:hypothetical protein [Sphingomonas gellani]